LLLLRLPAATSRPTMALARLAAAPGIDLPDPFAPAVSGSDGCQRCGLWRFE
jgi:hypothetical protein